MEAQSLAVHRSSVAASRLGSRSGNYVGAQSSRDPSLVPASLGKQQLWRFRVERKVTLLPARRQGNAARAKKSDTGFKFPGSLKVKESAESVGKDGRAAAEKGAEKLGGFSGSIKASATEKVPSPVKRTASRKDKNVVFVAGATGKVGRRVVRELVQLGYSVKAGTRNPEKSGQSLLEFAGSSKPQSDATGEEAEATEAEPKKKPSLFANLGLDNIFGFLKAPKKTPGVELVEVNLEKPDEIEDAIGEASVVVCAIGASEKEALNVTGPFRIDYKATENLIKAATSAKVNHFVLVTSLGTTGVGWPATALNLFWGVLVWKAKAEKALIESGIPFTIVRPGGMERPTDTYKETHNLLLDKANSRFGGQVSNLQIAELIASAVGNSKLAEYKILEAVAETTAPLRPIEELLAEIPTIYDSESLKLANKEEQAAKKQADEEEKQGKRAEIQAAKKLVEEEKARKKEEQRLAKQREEEERVAEQAKLQAVREKLQNEYAAAKEREEEARIAAEEALSEKEEIEKRVADLRAKIEAAAQAAREAKAVETAVTAAAREGKTLSEGEKRSVVAAERAKVDAEAKQKAAQEKDRRAAEAKAAAEKEKKEKDAEAAKVKAEEKRKTEAAKAEADKKAKAEAKEREQAEAKKKAEEDKKAKAEAEVKAKAETEKKAKAEEDKKTKAEAEKKAKAEAEKKAEAPKAAKEVVTAAKEAVPAAKEAIPAAKEAIPAAKEAVPAAKGAVPAAKKAVEVVASGKLIKDGEPPDEEIAKKAAQATKEAKAREQEALELAKAAAVFVWPWEKAKRTDGRPAAPSAKGKDSLPYSSTPLSPYAQYPDLKPPTSPRPSPPTPVADEGATKKVDSPPAKEVSSSNGPVDIKPKTSPAPSSDDSKGSEVDVGVGEVATLATDKAAETAAVVTDKATETAAAVTDKAAEIAALATEKTAEVAAREKEALELAKAATTGTFAWPWQKSSEESSPQPAQKSSSTDLPRTTRPLSPYWMYPDLKPPTSPRPSANKRKL